MNIDAKNLPITGTMRRFAVLARPLSLLPAIAALLLGGVPTSFADTFEITSGYCTTSPGGFEWALQQANANPGRDTIQVRTSFDVSGCTHLSAEQYPATQVTESVDIVGNGFMVDGSVQWVNPNGQFNAFGHCPSSTTGDLWTNYGGGFLDIGRRDTDNQGIEVTVTGLNMTRLTGVARVRKGATLRIEQAVIHDIFSVHHEICNEPIIFAESQSDVTLSNTRFERISVPETAFPDTNFPVVTSVIEGSTGHLVMDRVTMGGVVGNHTTAVGWFGGSVKIVNSQFVNSSGIWVESGPLDFVNSTYFAGIAGLKFKDSFLLGSTTARFEASTFWWGLWGDGCDQTRPGATCAPRILGFYAAAGSDVQFAGSAIGGQEADSEKVFLGDPGQFSSDAETWVQPRTPQNAAAIQAILPNALTAPPGLHDYPSFDSTEYLRDITPLLGTPAQPGVLIDVIDCVANPLLNPLDSLEIQTDVLGKARCDGNGLRNIGAVQTDLAPGLAVGGVGDGEVELSWTVPHPPTGTTISGYTIGYRVAGTSDPLSEISIPDPATVSNQVTGLVNGTCYEFVVWAKSADGDGPQSNAVFATPLGVPGIPVVTATAGLNQVQLSWSEPDTGGHSRPISYSVVYREQGQTSWIAGPGSLSGRTTLITGLTAGIEYEFGVFAEMSDGATSPDVGTASATPFGQTGAPVVTATPGGNQVALSWTQPNMGGHPGPFTYAVTYRRVGQTAWQMGPQDVQGLQATVTGLICGKTYQFAVVAKASDGAKSAPGMATATPWALPVLFYPSTVKAYHGKPLTIKPTVANLSGPVVYAVSKGSLPTGVSLNQNTGVISGRPVLPSKCSRSYPVTITLTQTGSKPAKVSSALTIQVFSSWLSLLPHQGC